MIDAFLEAHPHLKRDPDDLKELDARDKLPEENLRSRKRRQMEEDQEEEDDEEEEEEEEEEEARSGLGYLWRPPSSSDSDDRGEEEEEEEEEEGLLEAARCGDKDRAEQLIKAGCRVDCRDEVCLPHLSPPPSLHPSLSPCHSFFLSFYMYIYIYIYIVYRVYVYTVCIIQNKFFNTCMM